MEQHEQARLAAGKQQLLENGMSGAQTAQSVSRIRLGLCDAPLFIVLDMRWVGGLR